MTKYSFSLSSDLYLKDPLSSDKGKDLLRHGAPLILEMGLESFTARKLAEASGITEATVYKYFANKQKLLQYYFQLYWTWLEQQIKVFTAVEDDPHQKLIKAVRLLADMPPVAADPGLVSKEVLRKLVVMEGVKAFHHVQVDADNALKLYAPYKSVAALIASMIKTVDANQPYPYALATTLLEMSHSLEFYRDHLPSLTDFPREQDPNKLIDFLVHFINRFISN